LEYGLRVAVERESVAYRSRVLPQSPINRAPRLSPRSPPRNKRESRHRARKEIARIAYPERKEDTRHDREIAIRVESGAGSGGAGRTPTSPGDKAVKKIARYHQAQRKERIGAMSREEHDPWRD